MKLLLISHHAGSPEHGMAFRPFFMAREWRRQGHTVQILAADYSHVRVRQPMPAPASARARDQSIEGVDYRWYRTPRYRGNGWGRMRNVLAFLRGIEADAARLARDFAPDVVIASSTYPLDIWTARRLARRSGACLVFELHDLWPLSLIELAGMSPRHPFAWLCRQAETAAYRDADLVVSMLPKVHAHVQARGLDLRRLAIIPNGIAPDAWSTPAGPLRADVAQRLAEVRASGRHVIGYAGAMGPPNALDTLLDAAALLRDEPFGFILVGQGLDADHLAARVRRERLSNVWLLAPIDKAQIPAFLAALDVAYIGWRRRPIYRFGIAANKLMDYMMAGCAVVHAVEAGNDPVAESGCGSSVAPDDPVAVADALRRVALMPAAERQVMGQRGRDFVLARHTYPVLAQRFIDAVVAVRGEATPVARSLPQA